MSELFYEYKRPRAEIKIIQEFIKSFKKSLQLYKNKEFSLALEELNISYNYLTDIWDEYPKIKTLYFLMKSYFITRQYNQCLSLHSKICEKILIEKQRDKKINKEKNELFIKIEAKISVYKIFIHFIYDNLDKSVESIREVIKYLSENENLSLDYKIKYFWNFIKSFLKITGITKSLKFKSFKQDYDSMIIIEKKYFNDNNMSQKNNCLYEPVKKINPDMQGKYKSFMNLKIRTNLYENLDKEYYFINFGTENDKVMNFLQKNMNLYVRDNNKIKLLELFNTFLVLGKINLKKKFNMTMNEIIYIQKKRIEKFNIIYGNLVGAFRHIFKKYYINENIVSNRINKSQSLKEIKKQINILKLSLNNNEIAENKKKVLNSFEFNYLSDIKIPPNMEQRNNKILLTTKSRKKINEKLKNIFNKNKSKLNLKPSNSPDNKNNLFFNNYLKKTKIKNIFNLPKLKIQKNKLINNILNFSDGKIKSNSINKNFLKSIKSYISNKKILKKKINSNNINTSDKEENNFILRNINNFLITKLIDLFLPIYKIENNLIFEEDEEIKYKNIYPRKSDFFTDLKIPKIIKSHFSISVKGTNSLINQDAYFYYENYMLIQNLILLGVCDGHGKFGYLISDKISILFPSYLIYILIEDSLIKQKRDINKEIYRLFKLKEDPNEIKDMHILRYFLNKFNIDIEDIPIFHNDISLLKNKIYESFYYCHKDIKQRYNIDSEFSGTTISSCFILGETLYIINLGDSKLILGQFYSDFNKWESKSLSIEHTLDIPEENERISARGGRIDRMRNEKGEEVGPLRVFDKNKESNFPGLAVSRSIGDNFAKNIGVTYEPEVTKYKLKKEDKIIVIGTDGLFNCLTNDEIIEILGKFYYENKSAEEAAVYLIEIARNKTKFKKRKKKIILNSENSSNNKKNIYEERYNYKSNFDDITCIIVFLE